MQSHAGGTASPWPRRAVGLIAVVLSIAALRAARPVLLPVVTGIMFAALGWPMLHWLQHRIARPLALLLTILAIAVSLLAILGAVGWSTVSVAADLRERSDRLEALHQRASATAARFGLELPSLGGQSPGSESRTGATGQGASGADSTSGAAKASGPSSMASRIGVSLYETLGYLALAVGFAALILAELRDARERIRLRFPPDTARKMIGVSSEVAQAMRRYVKVKTVTSAIAGVATGVLSLLFGIQLAAVWALLAFLFEFVPTIGSILAVVPPVLYAFVQFEGFAKPLAALAVFTVVQLFLGNYVDPRIEGRLLSISPLVVLVAIVAGAWLWGAPGSLLGVPIIVAVTVITRHFDSTRWVWAILTEPNGDERDDATS